MKVKIQDIVDGMQIQSDMMHSYLNKETSQVVSVSEEELDYAEDELADDIPDWQVESVELARAILYDDNFLPLPDKFEINEYHLMERFISSLDDREIAASLAQAIKGRGAFRRFKDKVYYFGLSDEWFAFRDEAYRDIAIRWCKDHNIDYVD